MRINNGLLNSLLLASLAIAKPVLAADYVFTDLGTFGGEISFAQDINNNGQILGEFLVSEFSFSSGQLIISKKFNNFIYDYGTVQYLDNFVGGRINNYGQISGSGRDSPTASIYSNGSLQDLGNLGGGYSSAFSINNSGYVVGSSRTSSGYTNAFLYSNGTMHNLGTLGGNYSLALDINNSLQTVGSSSTSGDLDFYPNSTRAFLYSNGIMQDLGALNGDSFSTAYSINDNGQVVGASGKSYSDLRAFLYTNGAMQDLGNLGGSIAAASGINNKGQVVGSSSTSEDTTNTHAFLYSNGSMHDLNSFLDVATKEAGWTLNSAVAINDNGWIVGNATNANFFGSRAFLLSPVPELETYAMLLAGLGLLGVVAHRKKVAYYPRAKNNALEAS